jgi:hypothetical protein
VNDLFFGGSCLAPKEFAHICSVKIPKVNLCKQPFEIEDGSIEIEPVLSKGAILGYLEGIPVLGSAIAAISFFGYLYNVWKSADRLNKSVEKFNKMDLELDVDLELDNTNNKLLKTAVKVCNAAIDCAVNYNLLKSSALSIIPLAKPIVRIAQGLICLVQQRANSSMEEDSYGEI